MAPTERQSAVLRERAHSRRPLEPPGSLGSSVAPQRAPRLAGGRPDVRSPLPAVGPRSPARPRAVVSVAPTPTPRWAGRTEWKGETGRGGRTPTRPILDQLAATSSV